jgi:hypothetical protein
LNESGANLGEDVHVDLLKVFSIGDTEDLGASTARTSGTAIRAKS